MSDLFQCPLVEVLNMLAGLGNMEHDSQFYSRGIFSVILFGHEVLPQNRSQKSKPAGVGQKSLKQAPVFPGTSWFSRDWVWGLILILSVIPTYTAVWKAGLSMDARFATCERHRSAMGAHLAGASGDGA
jgi:hypothetical protein